MSRIIVLVLYFTLAPLIIIVSTLYLSYLSFQKNPNNNISSLSGNSHSRVIYAALPTNQNTIREEIIEKDVRIEIVRQFFAKYQSPLESYSQNVITAADAYGLDYRLIPAIAMQESLLCKKAPPGSKNCWGFGVYGGKVTKFDSYEQGINLVTRTLAKEYKEKMGLSEPIEIMKKYTPSSDGTWARSVNYFMDLLKITP